MKYYNFIEAFNTPLLNKKGEYQKSDKNDLHKYVVLYDYIINTQYLKNHSPLSMLEIGIRLGDSIKVWDDSPLFSKIVGVDITPKDKYPDLFDFSDKVTLEQGVDGYDFEVVKSLGEKHGKFDIILDDGDHMWESQVKFFNYYYSLLNDGGVIMCEDISQNYLTQLQQLCSQYEDFYVFDLRTKSNVHGNEIVAIIKK